MVYLYHLALPLQLLPLSKSRDYARAIFHVLQDKQAKSSLEILSRCIILYGKPDIIKYIITRHSSTPPKYLPSRYLPRYSTTRYLGTNPLNLRPRSTNTLYIKIRQKMSSNTKGAHLARWIRTNCVLASRNCKTPLMLQLGVILRSAVAGLKVLCFFIPFYMFFCLFWTFWVYRN